MLIFLGKKYTRFVVFLTCEMSVPTHIDFCTKIRKLCMYVIHQRKKWVPKYNYFFFSKFKIKAHILQYTHSIFQLKSF